MTEAVPDAMLDIKGNNKGYFTEGPEILRDNTSKPSPDRG